MSFEIHKVTPDDTLDLQTILEEARAFKASCGDPGWGDVPFTADHVARIIDHDDTYLAVLHGQPAGTMKLIEEDPEIWGPDKGEDGKALYIHRFAVANAFRGQGVGSHFIEWACQQVVDASRLHLRLDCNPANHKLREYYERHSFWYVGDSPVTDYPAALHERRV